MISAPTGIGSKRRSALRKVLLGLAALILVLVVAEVLLGLVVGGRLKATVAVLEERWGSLDPATLAPPPVEPAANRAKPIRAAAELVLVTMGEKKRLLGDMSAPGGRELLPDEIAALDEILERNRLALEVLGEALHREGSSWEIDYDSGIQAEIPPLMEVVDLARLNAAWGRRELLAGRHEGAVLSARRGLALADSLQREPVLIVQLVALTSRRLALGLVRDLLAGAEPGEDQLLGLQRAVESTAIGEGIRMGLLGEMKVFHQLFQEMDSGRRPGVVGSSSFLESPPIRWLVRPLLRENLRHYLEGMDGVLAYQGTPRYRREKEFSENPLARESRWYHFLVWMMLPDMGSVIDRGDLGEARVAVSATALALRRHRLAVGLYPESLEALVPAYLDELPLDPFTGEPPSYHREGEGFSLRSSGEDHELKGRPGTDHLLSWQIPS